MKQVLFFSNWRDKVVFSAPGAQPQVWYEDDRVEAVEVGLEAGDQIPAHPGSAGVYHFLEDAGQMAVGDETFAVQLSPIRETPPAAS